MRITVNGGIEVTDACSIEDLLAEKGLEGGGVVVEHNYRVVKRNDWQAIFLQENDNLEVLRFVGGG